MQNELSNFASKEKGINGNSIPYQSKLQIQSETVKPANQVPNLVLPGVGTSQINKTTSKGESLFTMNDSTLSSFSRDATLTL